MRVSATAIRIAATGAAILVASVLHYLTPHSQLLWHNLFQKLYYLPIIYAALTFGLRGGLIAAMVSTVCYIPHIVSWQHHPDYEMSQYAELILFFLVACITGLLADQGRRRREQLEAATRKLQQSHEQVRRADRLSAVGQLAASLAHEIRNPLGSIEGAANIIQSAATPAEVRDGSLNIIRKECQRLNRLLTNLLDFARPRAPEFRSMDVGKAVDSVFALLEPNARQRNIALRKTTRGTAPMLDSDAEQIRQVLLNLVMNAMQAMPEGGEVEVEIGVEKAGVIVAVKDQGVGIPEKDLDSIFDPFFTTKESGTGLGLSVAHQVITQHGGTIEARRNAGGGMTFAVVLPLEAREKR